MNYVSIIITVLIILVMLAKFYNMFNTIKKKGIKGVLTQKLIMISVVGIIIGIYVLINPDATIENPKTLITEYVSVLVN